jgi:hypothetical protein
VGSLDQMTITAIVRNCRMTRHAGIAKRELSSDINIRYIKSVLFDLGVWFAIPSLVRPEEQNEKVRVVWIVLSASPPYMRSPPYMTDCIVSVREPVHCTGRAGMKFSCFAYQRSVYAGKPSNIALPDVELRHFVREMWHCQGLWPLESNTGWTQSVSTKCSEMESTRSSRDENHGF